MHTNDSIRYGLSSRYRWQVCPASIMYSKGVIESSGPLAQEGTLAHSVGEFYIRQRFEQLSAIEDEAADLIPPEGLDIADAVEWNQALRSHAKEFVAFIEGLIPASCEQPFVALETSVTIPSISERLAGRLDVLIWIPEESHLIGVDYKYGREDVALGTEEILNPQLAGYLVAAMDSCSIPVETITAAVYQPRRIGRPAAEVLRITDAQKWREIEYTRLVAEVAAIEAERPLVQPGGHCKYCKGRINCPKSEETFITMLETAEDTKKLLDMPPEDLVALYSCKTLFTALWEDIEERMWQIAAEGHPNVTVSTSKGRQMWADPEEAARALMALGRSDLLKPAALSKALPAIPEGLRETLIKRSAPGKTLKIVTKTSPNEVLEKLRKYVSPS